MVVSAMMMKVNNFVCGKHNPLAGARLQFAVVVIATLPRVFLGYNHDRITHQVI
jgi:hypothetical protein